MTRAKTNKNNGAKLKDKETKRFTSHDNPAIIFIANLRVDCPTRIFSNNCPSGIKCLSNKEHF